MKRSPVTNYPSAFSLLCKKLNSMSAVFSTSIVHCTPVSGRATVGVQKGVPWAMRTEELVTLEEVRDGRRGEELVCWLWGEGEEPRGEINGWWLPAALKDSLCPCCWAAGPKGLFLPLPKGRHG